MDLDSAVAGGAMALFGEKYADRVRVVSVSDFSKELCGGTHVARSGDIGLCKIVYEGSISAGVRRIEAVTGSGALQRFQHTTSTVSRVAEMLRASEPELIDHVERLLQQQRTLEKQVDQLKEKVARAQIGEVESHAREMKGVKVLAARVEALDRTQMRALADSLRNKWRSAVVVLASADNGSVSIVSAVTKDLTSKVHAGKLAGSVAQAVGGKGGGRPDMAEAGGKDAAALPAALDSVYAAVESML
jgi:alanyl-tRNA synthetase